MRLVGCAYGHGFEVGKKGVDKSVRDDIDERKGEEVDVEEVDGLKSA